MISKILNIIAHHLHVFKKKWFLYIKRPPPPNLHSLLLSAAKTVQKDIIFCQLLLYQLVMELPILGL